MWVLPSSGRSRASSQPAAENVSLPEPEFGDLGDAAKAAGCKVDDPALEGSQHEEKDFKASDYETNPPTSGNHVVPPRQQADGAYSEYPDPIFTVHSLEHGRIDLQYSPDLSEDDQLALKGLFDEDFDGMLLFPNPEMPYEVAATAWTQMLTCDTYESDATLDAIRAFRDTYRGQGPEAVPIVIPDA